MFSALNYYGTVFKSLSYLYEVVRTNFPADFLEFSQFSTWIWRKLWRYTAMEMRTLLCVKIGENRVKIDPQTATQYLFKECPLERTACRQTEEWQTNGKTDKQHIFARTAGARSMIFPKLCMVIEDVETILKGANHFSIQHSFFHRVHGKIRGEWLTRGFSATTL